jgi:chromosome segregation ATPase
MVIDPVQAKLNDWLGKVPDYYEVVEAYENYGELKAQIVLVKRQIGKALESLDIEKPRSNEAKKKKDKATAELNDTLADLEARLARVEAQVKRLEYIKTMFNAASYATKIKAGF